MEDRSNKRWIFSHIVNTAAATVWALVGEIAKKRAK
jgi:hypothetical protein